ncbi:MAG: ATP-binding protein, partial [Bacillota bacterium]
METINDRIQISSGKDANGALTGEICNFVHQVSGKGVNDTKRLYSMIMELMTNTKQHAYLDKGGIMGGNWYIFAEGLENSSVRFVFLDTGIGIPATINKKFSEKIKDLMRIFGAPFDESKYISSALRGEFRSETRQQNRGKGLPGIYEDSCSGLISGLVIISGSGECRILPDCTIEENQLETNFNGTLYIWNFHEQKGVG